MFIPEELVDIIKRIASNTHTEADLQKLGQIFDVTVAAGERSIAINRDANGATIATGDGNTILNITFQADGLRIGENVYQGDGAEGLKSILQEILQPKVSIDWQKSSRDLLDEQIQRLTSNPLTHTEGIAYRTEQVYVPLGLVERKRQSRRGGDVTPAQGSLLYEETEITQKFEHNEFLEQVLQQGKSPRSSGTRIAIIGEPGAGKTTLLQQIARWVSDNIDRSIVIWVSLADLQGQSLEQYLLERWLPAIVRHQGQAEVFTKEKNALLAQFQQQQVWLVLDGADEMQMSSGSPLSEIGQQIRTGALLQQARMVLSCRLNLWDGSSNALDSFDNYRTLEFSYPQQVEQFIYNWFGSAPLDKTHTGQTLCNALREVGKERIQDLVKNPLRLTLLCFNWYLGEGKLPETKAELYEQFVDDFYEWKKGIFATTGEQRRRLNVALGELAREAIDLEEIRFRLRQEFICKYLGEPDDTDSLFWLALKLGWLNQVGVEAENPKKKVYAFFHPTFQEYFTALSIDDWDFFIPKNHINCPVNLSIKQNYYRIFELQWKEIILFWLDNYIQEYSKKILSKIIEKSVANDIPQEVLFYLESTNTIVENKLLDIENSCNEGEQIFLIGSLLEIDPNNTQGISRLIKVVRESKNELFIFKAVVELEKIALGNRFAITNLESLLNDADLIYSSISTLSVDSLFAKLDKGIFQIIVLKLVTSLWKIDPENSNVIVCLENLIRYFCDSCFRVKTAKILEKIDIGNLIAVDTLNGIKRSFFNNNDDGLDVIDILLHFDATKGKAVETLLKLVKTENTSDAILALAKLKDLATYEHVPKIIKDLKLHLLNLVSSMNENQNSHYGYRISPSDLLESYHEVIVFYAQKITYLDFYQAWNIDED